MNPNYNELREQFGKSMKTITAIGDEVRQSIIITLLDGGCHGFRVGEITGRTHLSRPAISHHLKILCDANIVNVKKQGTMNFYFLNPDRQEIQNIYNLCGYILDEMDKLQQERGI
jgi:DNA-binding transcriptional ArsR family regulator